MFTKPVIVTVTGLIVTVLKRRKKKQVMIKNLEMQPRTKKGKEKNDNVWSTNFNFLLKIKVLLMWLRLNMLSKHLICPSVHAFLILTICRR